MVIFLDTSVLVAALLEKHPDYHSSHELLKLMTRTHIQGVISSHSLAECYATLTVLPILLVPPEEACRLVVKFMERFRVMELSIDDYRKAIQRVSQRGLRSGVVFDALLFQAALKGGAAQIVTWNKQDFTRLSGQELTVVTPKDFLLK